MKPTIALFSLALFTAAGTAAAQDSANTAFRPGWYVAPMVTYFEPDNERCGVDGGPGGNITLGHRGDFASLEIWGQFLSVQHNCTTTRPAPTMFDPEATETIVEEGDTTLNGVGLNLLVGPFFETAIISRIYGLVGFGVIRRENHPQYPTDDTTILGDAGLGYMQPLQVFGYDFNIRAEGRYRYDVQQSPRPEGTPPQYQDLVFNIGVQIPLAREVVTPPAVVVPAAVVPVITDSDGDGVLDPDDQCPNTPAGAKVNAVGCPLPPCKTPAPGEAMDLQGCAVGDVIVLQGVNFEFDQARLTPNAETILQGVATALNAAPAVYIEIGGHTDGKGSDEYNQSLSQRRAQSVLDYLVARGVPAARLSSAGYGEAQPIASNETDEGREQNRRVELKVVAGSQTLPVMAPVGVDPADATPVVTEPAAQVVPEAAPAAQAIEPAAAMPAETSAEAPAEAMPAEPAPADAAMEPTPTPEPEATTP